MNLVEHIGSGIKRIREALASYGLKLPIIRAEGDWFSITFTRKGTYDSVEGLRGRGKVFIPSEKDDIEGVSEGVNEGVNSLLAFIQRTPGLRSPQISRAMGIPVKTLERWLKKLREQNKIEFMGSPKTGGYRKKEAQNKGGMN
jgi:ATP-dependent DNA helicase RecG